MLQQKESPGVTILFRWTIGNQAGIAKQMVSHQASAPPLPAMSAFKEKHEDGEKKYAKSVTKSYCDMEGPVGGREMWKEFIYIVK